MGKDIHIRHARIEDIDQILIVEQEAWPEGLRATREMFKSRLEIFPEGTLVAVHGDTIMGVVVSEILNYDLDNPIPTWVEATDNGFITNHNPNGNALYGVDLSVTPLAGGKASKLLMEGLGRLIIANRLEMAVLGGRIPRYYRYVKEMSVEEYVYGLRKNKPRDPEVYLYTKMGLEIKGILPDYIEDPESCNYGVLLVWHNPFYRWPFPSLWAHLFRVKE